MSKTLPFSAELAPYNPTQFWPSPHQSISRKYLKYSLIQTFVA